MSISQRSAPKLSERTVTSTASGQIKQPKLDPTEEALAALHNKKPLATFVPSKGAIKFWETMFPRLDEVSIVDYIEAIVPVFESELGRKFTKNSLLNLADKVDYEGRHIVNKYESMFFIDKIWNNLEEQSEIWNQQYKSMAEVVQDFKTRREKMRKDLQSSVDPKYMTIAPADVFKPYTLKDYLPEMRWEKAPHSTKVAYTIECIKAPTGLRVNAENEICKGLKIDLDGKEVLCNGKILKYQLARSKLADLWDNYSRVLFGEERVIPL